MENGGRRMILLCGIDSESYSHLIHAFYTDLDKLKNDIDNMKNELKTFYKDMTVKWENNRCTLNCSEEEDFWYVFEYFEVNSDIVLVHYHAYEGVDFEIVGEFDDMYQARDKMATSSFELYSEYEDLKDKSYEWLSYNDACFDTGQEWQIWKIVCKEDKK